MTLNYAGIQFEHREIALRNKPQSMLLLSHKGTVPVLCVDGLILDQSLDIMHWALEMSDPDGWAVNGGPIHQGWVEKNDGPFKTLLDKYKYPNRHPKLNQENVLSVIKELMLKPMEIALQSSQYLIGSKMTWVDVAIFPFIRQFSMVNPKGFEDLPFTLTKKWLNRYIESELFNSVMLKYPTWID